MKKIFKYLGNILMFLSIAFLVNRIVKMQIDFSRLSDRKTMILLSVLVVVYAIHLLLIALSWKIIIKIITQKNVPLSYLQKVFCKSNLMKYIPGNILQYVGRNQVAVDCDLSHADIALSTVLDVVANVLGVSIVSGMGLLSCERKIEIKNILQEHINIILVLFLFLLMSAALILFRKKISLFFRKYGKILTSKNVRSYLFCISWYLFFAIYTGILFGITLMYIADVPIENMQQICIIIGAYQLSWLVGFLLPGAPGGIGVREIILSFLLGFYFNVDSVTLAVVIYRFVTICGDFLAMVFAEAIYKVGHNKKLPMINLDKEAML